MINANNDYAQLCAVNSKQLDGKENVPPIATKPLLGDLDVTENGDYSASTEGLDGYANVHVDAGGGTGLPKLATPSALATLVSGKQCNILYTGTRISSAMNWSNVPGGTPKYTIIYKPTSSMSFEFEKTYSDGGLLTVIFTASSNSVSASYYDSNQSSSSIITGLSVTAGKTYLIKFRTRYAGSATSLYIDYDSIVEYDGPISFTVE